MARVSVIIGCFNSMSTIGRAVDSVFAQTVRDCEVVIVDDGSTDASPAWLQEHYASDPRVQLILRKANGGPSLARNDGIAAATGEWIAILDSDDAWLPNRLEDMLSSGDGCDVIFDGLLAYDVWADEITGRIMPPFGSSQLSLEDLLLGWAGDVPIQSATLKPLMRASFLREHSIQYDPELRAAEDLLMYCRLLCHRARVTLVPSAGYIYTTTVGKKSRKASPHSRSRRNGRSAARKLIELKTMFAGKLSKRECVAFDYRVERIVDYDSYIDFRNAMLNRKPIECVRLALSHAGVRAEILRTIEREFLKRSGRRPRLNC